MKAEIDLAGAQWGKSTWRDNYGKERLKWTIKMPDGKQYQVYSMKVMNYLLEKKKGICEIEEKKWGDVIYTIITNVEGMGKKGEKEIKKEVKRITPEMMEKYHEDKLMMEKDTRLSVELQSTLKTAVEYMKALREWYPERRQEPDIEALADRLWNWIQKRKGEEMEKWTEKKQENVSGAEEKRDAGHGENTQMEQKTT